MELFYADLKLQIVLTVIRSVMPSFRFGAHALYSVAYVVMRRSYVS